MKCDRIDEKSTQERNRGIILLEFAGRHQAERV